MGISLNILRRNVLERKLIFFFFVFFLLIFVKCNLLSWLAEECKKLGTRVDPNNICNILL